MLLANSGEDEFAAFFAGEHEHIGNRIEAAAIWKGFAIHPAHHIAAMHPNPPGKFGSREASPLHVGTQKDGKIDRW